MIVRKHTGQGDEVTLETEWEEKPRKTGDVSQMDSPYLQGSSGQELEEKIIWN